MKPWEQSYNVVDDKKPWEQEYKKEQPKVSKTGAGLAGVAQGVSLGWSDEVDNWISEKMPWYDDMKANMGNEYSQAIIEGRKLGIKPSEIRRQYEEAAQEQHGGLYTAGQVAGGLTSAVIPGGAVAKGVGLGGKMIAGAKAGATLGAIEGAGLAQEGEGISGGIEGGLIGGGLGGALPLAGGAIKTGLGLGRDLTYKTAEVVSGLPEGAIKKGIHGNKFITKTMNQAMGDIAPELKLSADELLRETKNLKDEAMAVLSASGQNIDRATIHNTIKNELDKIGLPPKTKEKVYGFVDQYLENPQLRKVDTIYGPMAASKETAKYSYNTLRNIVEGMQDQVNFSVASKDNATSKAFSVSQHILNEKILSDMPEEYMAVWDKVIKNSDVLGGIAGIKKTDVMYGSKQLSSLVKWDRYIDSVINDAKKEITKGNHRGRELTKLKALDQLKGTTYAQIAEDKAAYELLNPPGGAGEEMGRLRAFSSPVSRGIINTLQGVGRAGVVVKEMQGLNAIAKKFTGTKWGEALTDSLKNNGTQGMAATHMMLMATDKGYREKYGESK